MRGMPERSFYQVLIWSWLKIYFNDSKDYEDSKESDSDDEAKNDTCESVTEENEIKA